MQVTLDNLIAYLEQVTLLQWENFLRELEIAETYGKVPEVTKEIGKQISRYHYNVRVGKGSGAIHIGYKHNTSREGQKAYSLRVEVNPSKELKTPSETSGRDQALRIIADCFKMNTKRIKGVDLAFDVPVSKESLFILPTTGKERQIIRGSTYFGESGKDGRLKVYDKKKELREKQGKEIEEEHLTRIEYSLRLPDHGITLDMFGKVQHFGINGRYQVTNLDFGQATGVIKACVIAVATGHMELKELSRTYKDKTKKALEAMGLLDLDRAYQRDQREIFRQITNVFDVSSITESAPV